MWRTIDSSGRLKSIGSTGPTGPTGATGSSTTIGAFGNIITPSTLSPSNVNDYNPTGLSGSTVMRLTGDAGTTSQLNGVVAQATGALLVVINIGNPNIQIGIQNTGSVAANRFWGGFGVGGLLTLGGNASTFTFYYDAILARWVPIGGIV